MAYRIDHGEDIDAAVRRIAIEQLDEAIASADAIERDPEEAVHDVRKRCKKVRGLLRLVRPAMHGDVYRLANDTARDASRQLSAVRDTTALHETFLTLVEVAPDDVAGTEEVDALLAERRDGAIEALDADDERVVRAVDLLSATRATVEDWELDERGADALTGGLAKTFGRGRDALAVAIDAPTPDHFHELRKRTKYTRYHLRLLAGDSPSVIAPLQRAFHRLSDALGDAHDLAVLERTLDAEDPSITGLGDLSPTRHALSGVRVDLERRSVGLASRLLHETPDAFADRIAGCRAAGERHGPEPVVGDIEALFA